MKKILISTALICSAYLSFANDTLDKDNLECHCEKHGMIFDVKDGTLITEMNKHCMINEDKKNSTVKFLDENSAKTIKCSVKNGKIETKSCSIIKTNLKSNTSMPKMNNTGKMDNMSNMPGM